MNFRPPMGGFGQPAMGGMMGPGMGQPMMMGGPRPGYNSPMPLGPIAKSTTLYVGKIAPTIPEDVIRSLLEACGTVKSWKPVLNEDGSPKGFGFCEYQSPEAVTRALRLLNNLKVDGQELLLKCTSATERYIQQHQAHKQRESAQQATGNGKPADPEGEEDDDKLGAIMAIVSARAATQQPPVTAPSAQQQAQDFLAESLLPPPPKKGGSSAAAPAGTGAEADRRDRDRGGEKEGRDRRSRSSRDPSRDPARQKELEDEMRRKQAKREAEKKAAAEQHEYDKKVLEWERHERQRLKDVEAAQEALRRGEKDRARAVRTDNDTGDEDESMEPWLRKLFAATKRGETRRRKRGEEAAEEKGDAERLEHLRRKQQRRMEKAEAAAAARSKSEPQPNGDAIGAESSQQASRPPSRSPAAHTGGAKIAPDDAIMQAMLAQAREAPTVTSRPPASPHNAAASAGPPGAAEPRPRSGGVAAAFGEDDEDEPKRRLIPLQYTDEEQKAAAATAAQPAAAQEAAGPDGGAKAQQAQIAQLKQSLPRSKEAVFAATIKWDAYAEAQPKLGEKVGKWVGGQIEKLMGQEEGSLRDFVLECLGKRTSPEALLGELEPIFDNEAEEFIIKLFQVIIYETGRWQILGHV